MQRQLTCEGQRGRLVADANDMREPECDHPQEQPRHHRADIARQSGACLYLVTNVIGPEHRTHQHNGHKPTGETQQQEGRQFHIELQLRHGRQFEFGHATKLNAVDDSTCNAGNHDGRKSMNGKMAQHHFEGEERAGNGGIKTGRDGSSHGAAQKVAPSDSICIDAPIDPSRNDSGQMHHWPFAPRRAPRAKCHH